MYIYVSSRYLTGLFPLALSIFMSSGATPDSLMVKASPSAPSAPPFPMPWLRC